MPTKFSRHSSLLAELPSHHRCTSLKKKMPFFEVDPLLKEAIKQTSFGISPNDVNLGVSPDRNIGDIGFPCFVIAKRLQKNPADVAKLIESEIVLPKHVEKVKAVGPYVNFYLSRHSFLGSICSSIRTVSSFGSSLSGLDKSIVLEHTSINPNASPHIGRSRNALIGDCLARILRFEGYDVEVRYYVNDMGKQIALLALECQDKNELEFDELLDIYVAANKKAEKDEAYSSQAFELLRKLESNDMVVKKSFRRIVDICIKGQTEILSLLNIRYDKFDYESDFVHDPHLDEVTNSLRESDVLFEDDKGRQVIDLKKIGFDRDDGRYFVIRRANGSSLYGYRDIAYNIFKDSCSADRNIVVLGEDHRLYSEQMSVILKAIGRKYPQTIYYSYVLLQDAKMSTRKGTVVLLKDLLKEAVNRVKKAQDLSQHSTEKGSDSVALKVAVGAIRFSILKTSPIKNVTFDWEDSLSLTGDTGPYLQYSYARISSLVSKHGQRIDEIQEPFSPVTVSDTEWELVLKLAMMQDYVSKAAETFNPSILANYALAVARQFNTFYHECPVLNAPEPEVQVMRLNLCLATQKVIKTLLFLLGIESPEVM